MRKRIDLQQLKLELKLNSVLNDQVMLLSSLEYIIYRLAFIVDGSEIGPIYLTIIVPIYF